LNIKKALKTSNGSQCLLVENSEERNAPFLVGRLFAPYMVPPSVLISEAIFPG